MGVVVQLNRSAAATSSPTPSYAKARLRMKRDETLDALTRMLTEACGHEDRIRIRIEERHDGHVAVAVLDGRMRMDLTKAYPDRSIDDFAMVVRGCVPRWRITLTRRLEMRIV